MTRTFPEAGHFSVTKPFIFGVRGAFEGTTSSISTNWSCLPILQSLPTQHGAFVKLISAFAFFTLESAKKISRKIWFIIEHSTTLFLYLWECWLQLGAFGLLQWSLVSIFLLRCLACCAMPLHLRTDEIDEELLLEDLNILQVEVCTGLIVKSHFHKIMSLWRIFNLALVNIFYLKTNLSNFYF